VRTLLTRRAGQPGTTTRYRYDDAHGQRLKKIELIVDRMEWRPKRRRRVIETVEVRIARPEDLLRERSCTPAAGGTSGTTHGRSRGQRRMHWAWAQEEGWSALKNGELLRAAEGKFAVLVTADKRLQYQQNIASSAIAVVVMMAESTRLRVVRWADTNANAS
jgi:hypothetical protein